MVVTRQKDFEKYDAFQSVFGELDEYMIMLTDAFDVDVSTVGTSLTVSGEKSAVEDAVVALNALEKIAERETLTRRHVSTVIDCVRTGGNVDVNELLTSVAVTARGRVVRAKTFGQRRYIDAIKSNGVVFGVGPAGTGKTYLAVALAVLALKSGEADKIILTRPAVEAGEKLGFLPGDLAEKVDPYLRPLYDALKEFMGEDAFTRSIERGSIEIAPLAYMRGRTLRDSFIILDEAQNTTPEQMKMFLTRMGENSKIVVTGDITQIDLPKSQESGMKQAIEALKDVEGVKIVSLSSKDVVRNEFVARIIDAYDRYEQSREEKQNSADKNANKNKDDKQ